ncbi:MAG: hypothetical protein IJC50_09610 [Clostridia bacterium]|nr:hypothetical protein [Clostridia bacterium]
MGYCSNNCSRNYGHCSNVTPFGIIRAVSRIGCNCGYSSRGCGCRFNGRNGGSGSGYVRINEFRSCGECARDYAHEGRESDCGCSYVK